MSSVSRCSFWPRTYLSTTYNLCYLYSLRSGTTLGARRYISLALPKLAFHEAPLIFEVHAFVLQQ